jgi:hypothetical protein
MTPEERAADILVPLPPSWHDRCPKLMEMTHQNIAAAIRVAVAEERTAITKIVEAVLAEHLPASESPVDPIRNIGHAQVAVARRILEEIKARGAK